MNLRPRLFLSAVLSAGLFVSLVFLLQGGFAGAISTADARPVLAPQGSGYVLLAWNDLGMHCYNDDFQDMAVLPPYNTLWAQVVKVGDPPQLVTSGIKVSYAFPNNTYSVGKTNFWSYAQSLFNLANPLPDNTGLKGKGLSGSMDLAGDHFIAEGIPLTEFSDNALSTASPYQLAHITVQDAATQATLAELEVVAPVSSELHCDNCHADDGDATVSGGIQPTGRVATNILALHDKLSQDQYPAGLPAPLMNRRPVLCAECHSSNALGTQGAVGVSSLSNAMHKRHSGLDDITPDTDGCYNCHPGPATQCLRDVMSQNYGMTCLSCHGDITHVAANPSPWLKEPRCDTCHGKNAYQNKPLFRFSTGHGKLYCEACHDSTHAIATSRESNDALKFIALQGHPGTLKECGVCHLAAPTSEFVHANLPKIYLPFISQ